MSPKPPLPDNESERLEDLYAVHILDTPREERFDHLVRIAAYLYQVPIALISLIDVKRQWFKACYGLTISETSRDLSFCAYTIVLDQTMIIPDMHLDPRFVDHALVKGTPFLRFYAGHPLHGPRGHKIGTLCILDFVPRVLNEEEIEIFQDLAHITEREVNSIIEQEGLTVLPP